MTKLRLVLLATTALTAMHFASSVSHAQGAPTVVAQAREEVGPDGKPKQPPKAAPPPARPRLRRHRLPRPGPLLRRHRLRPGRQRHPRRHRRMLRPHRRRTLRRHRHLRGQAGGPAAASASGSKTRDTSATPAASSGGEARDATTASSGGSARAPYDAADGRASNLDASRRRHAARGAPRARGTSWRTASGQPDTRRSASRRTPPPPHRQVPRTPRLSRHPRAERSRLPRNPESGRTGGNIEAPATKIDGTVVAPGAKFDFWKVVGDLHKLPGEGPGNAIEGGKITVTGAFGGGICTTSTTLFNAAFRAGMIPLARQNHNEFITRYPPGLDATVWQVGNAKQTMSFRNDTKYPILIQRIITHQGSIRWLTFKIWSVPNGRTAKVSNVVIDHGPRAISTIVHDSSKPVGYRYSNNAPADGAKVWVTVSIYDHGKLHWRKRYFSNYPAVDGVTIVGTRKS